jgi:hypothetical protein
MVGFFLYFSSVFFVFTSSYFISSLLKTKKTEIAVIYWFIIISAQVIVSFELLSLFKAINQINFLILNTLVLTGFGLIWLKRKKSFALTLNFKNFLQKIIFALKKDNILGVMSIFFIFSVICSFFLAVYAPVNLWDTMIYHATRAAMWIQNGSIGHFETSSIRQVMFPPNSEILLMWNMLFIKKDFLMGLTQFSCFAGIIYVLYAFMTWLKFSTQRILWAIFIFAAIPGVIVQSSSTQNDLVLGFFLLTSIYLCFYGLIEEDNISLAISAVSLAISIGVKSSVFLFIPGMVIAFIILSVKKYKKRFYLPLFKYLMYFTPAFIVFGAYIYVINYLDYKNFLGLPSYIHEHTYANKDIKSFLANFIRYHYALIDFTGFEPGAVLNFSALLLRTAFFAVFSLKDSDGLTNSDNILLNTRIHDNLAGLGPFGLLIFLPIIYLGAFKYIFSKSKKTYILGLCGMISLMFIFTISTIMGYEIFNNRYLITSLVITAPALAFTYIPSNTVNLLKLAIFGISVYFFVKTPLFIELRPLLPFYGTNLITNSREEVRYNTGSKNSAVFREPVEYLEKTAQNNSKIGLILSEDLWYYIYFIKNPTWKIYPLDYNFLSDKKLKNLDFLVIFGESQKVYSLKLEKGDFYTENKIDFSKINKFFKQVYSVKTCYLEKNDKFLIYSGQYQFYIYERINPAKNDCKL